MAGIISNPSVQAPSDPWTLWRDANTLANAGAPALAERLTRDILSHPQTPDVLRKQAERRQRSGWAFPKAAPFDRDGPVPF